MSEPKAPWKWNNRRYMDYLKEYEWEQEEYERLCAEGKRGGQEWLDLTDADDNVVVEYAGCGSHEITVTSENAAILEAAATLYKYVLDCAEGGDADAVEIMDGIENRRIEFEE